MSGLEHRRRGRIGQSTRPRLRYGFYRDGAVAPRHQVLPVGERAPPADDGSEHSTMAEHALYPRKSVVDTFVSGGAPEPLLVVRNRIDGLGCDPHIGDGGAEPALGTPAVQLPADAVDDIRCGERPRVQPGALRRFAGIGVDFDTDAGHHEFRVGRRLDEPIGSGSEPERDLIDAVERGFELDHRVEVAGRDAGHDTTGISAGGERVEVSALGAETTGDILRR